MLFVCYNKNFIIINEFLKNIQYICKLRKIYKFQLFKYSNITKQNEKKY